MIEQISYERVTSISTDMKTGAKRMRDILEEGKQNMSVVGSEEVWKSDAAMDLKNKFDTLASKFEVFYQAIERYSAFLDSTVTTYREADKAISSASSNLAS